MNGKFPVRLEVKYVLVVADLKYVFPGNQGSRKVQFAPPHSGYTEIGKYKRISIVSPFL